MVNQIQLIKIKTDEESIKSKDITISSLDKPLSFDLFDINIIDLNSISIWYGSDRNHLKTHYKKDFEILKKLLNNSNSINILIFPQNMEIQWSTPLQYHAEELSKMGELISDNKISLVYERNYVEIEGNRFFADFYFSDDENMIIEAEKSNKALVISPKQNLYFSTLELSSYKDLKIFLTKINVISKRHNAPVWFDELNYFNDLELKDLIHEQELIISQSKEKIKESQYILDSNSKFKSILFTQSNDLVSVVLEILGNIFCYDFSKFEDIKKEDFRMELNDLILIGEIKGVKGNVKSKYISQVDVHLQDYLENNDCIQDDKKVKSVLIINYQRDIHPLNREKINDQQIKIAKRNNCLIIDSHSLLKTYEKFLNKELDVKKLKEYIGNKKGLFDLNEI